MAKSPAEMSLGREKPPQKYFCDTYYSNLINLTHSTSQSLSERFLHGTRFSTHGNNCATSFDSQIAVYHRNFVSVRVLLQMCFNLKCQWSTPQNLKPCLLFHWEFVLAQLPSSQAEAPPLRTKASQFDSINLSSSYKETDKDANKPLSWHVT